MLDTHVFVWLMQGVERISERNKEIIRAAATSNSLCVAAITPWEIAMLTAKTRLALPMDVGEWLDAALGRSGIELVPLSPEIAVASNRLPGNLHGDPADRMIIASARHLNAWLITEDSAILGYSALGYVSALQASK